MKNYCKKISIRPDATSAPGLKLCLVTLPEPFTATLRPADSKKKTASLAPMPVTSGTVFADWGQSLTCI